MRGEDKSEVFTSTTVRLPTYSRSCVHCWPSSLRTNFTIESRQASRNLTDGQLGTLRKSATPSPAWHLHDVSNPHAARYGCRSVGFVFECSEAFSVAVTLLTVSLAFGVRYSGLKPCAFHSCCFETKRCFTARCVASAGIAALLDWYTSSLRLVRSNYSTSISTPSTKLKTRLGKTS